MIGALPMEFPGLRAAAIKNPMISPRSSLVYSFLPSQPGTGTTKLAINASMAMARHEANADYGEDYEGVKLEAREKVLWLKEQGLHEKVAYILSRHLKTDLLQIEPMQSLLGEEAHFSFCKDSGGMSQAVGEGKAVNQNAELRRQCTVFAYNLLDRPLPEELSRKETKKEWRGFGEQFQFRVSKLASANSGGTKSRVCKMGICTADASR